MNIRILQLIEGAKAATGTTVVIDVFRAFSVEACFFALGARRIYPVGDSALAYQLKEQHPDWILAGERHGKILPGFDTGNAPSLLAALNPAGKTVVHTTSAGTQGIANAVNATEILGASLLTAKATTEYIRRSGATDVSLVCMGLEALAPTDEDTLCAEYIKSLLEGNPIPMADRIRELKYTSAAKFFDKAQAEVFPEADFHICTQLDKFDFALRLNTGSDGLPYMEKITPADGKPL